ncbi:hypothetical protein BYT27DRAFT_7239522 [Phlegmacium glaucopus]|nr:hypothetical protein BYT27DRAFT_7239522 [Phlegmacium glaucopus]
METTDWEASQLELIAKDEQLLHSFQTLKYINLGLLAVLIYDHCLTFNLERTRIWTLRWRLPKFLFMVNRYFLPPFFFQRDSCGTKYASLDFSVFPRKDTQPGYAYRCDARIFTIVHSFPTIMTVEIMLMIRVLALYANSKSMAFCLMIQFFVQSLGLVIFAAFILPKIRGIAGGDIFTGCLIDVPDWAYLSWLHLLIMEITLIIMVIYKCREYETFTPTLVHYVKSEDIRILARDSVVYFISVAALLFFNFFYARQHKLLCSALTLIEQAFSTMARHGRAVPTLLFRGPESVTYETEGRAAVPDIVEEPDEIPRRGDEENQDQLLELQELGSTNTTTARTKYYH